MARDIVMKPPTSGPRLGRLSPLTHVLVYVLLVGMIAVDYYLLSQTLTLLLRNDSQYGSIGVLMYIITAGISAAIVTIPHVVAVLIRRIETGISTRGWAVVATVLGILWAAILLTITAARIKAGLDAQTAGGLTGLVGTTSTATAGFSWTAPDTIMAFLMLGVLVTSGALSFVTAWLTTRPLVTAVERGWRRVARLRRYRDRLLAEQLKAADAIQQQAEQDAADRARYELAQETLRYRLEQVRAGLAVRLAQRQRDPQGTSQIIHELQLRRPAEQGELPATTASATVRASAQPTTPAAVQAAAPTTPTTPAAPTTSPAQTAETARTAQAAPTTPTASTASTAPTRPTPSTTVRSSAPAAD